MSIQINKWFPTQLKYYSWDASQWDTPEDLKPQENQVGWSVNVGAPPTVTAEWKRFKHVAHMLNMAWCIMLVLILIVTMAQLSTYSGVHIVHPLYFQSGVSSYDFLSPVLGRLSHLVVAKHINNTWQSKRCYFWDHERRTKLDLLPWEYKAKSLKCRLLLWQKRAETIKCQEECGFKKKTKNKNSFDFERK